MCAETVRADSVGNDNVDFDKILKRAIELLKEKKRISYAALKYELKVDNGLFSAIRDEIVDSQQLAVDEGGKVLVWTGGEPKPPQPEPEPEPLQPEPDFDEVLKRAIELLKEKIRISYGALKYALKVSDTLFAAVRDEIVNGRKLAYVEDGTALVWTGGPAEFDLTFNEAHPPLMRDRDHFPPDSSNPTVVGVFKIEPKYFERVKDPLYPCEIAKGEMVSPHEFQVRKGYRNKKAKEVARYELKREKFWKLIDRKHYAKAESVTQYIARGIHTRKMDMSVESWGQRFETHLNVNLSVPLTEDPDPEAGGPSAGGDAGFSAEMSHDLSITHETEVTYTYDKQDTLSVTRQPGDYLIWQLCERMSTWRVPVGKEPMAVLTADGQPVELVIGTAREYEDYLPAPGAPPGEDPGGGVPGGGGPTEPPQGDPIRG
jgi:hypothetical protein